MKKHFKKTYAFLAAGLLALATGATIVSVKPVVESAKAANTITDTIVANDLNATGNSYVEFSDVVKESGATYAGQSATDENAIQLRSKNSNSGIVSTKSGGNIRKISVDWNSTTNSQRVLDVYGSTEPFTQATELYNIKSPVEKIGSINFSSTPNFLEISENWEYVGVRSNSGAMYLNSISFEWEAISTEASVTILGEANGLSGDSLTLSASTRNFTGTEFTYAWSVAEDDTELVSLTNETTSEVTVNLLKEGTATINLTVTSGEESASATFDINIAGILSVKEAKETIDVGHIAYVRGIVFAEYGNSIYIADEDGTGMQLYSFNDLGVNVGEEVVATGTMATYNNGLQLSNPEILSHEVTTKTVTPMKVTYDELNDNLCNNLISLENMVYHSGTSTSQNIYFYGNGDSSKQYVLYNNNTSSSYRTELAAAMKDWQEDVTTVTLVGTHIRHNSTLEMNLTSTTTYEVDKVDTFARSFIANLNCDPTGQTAPSVEEWNALAEEFALLSEEEKALFKQDTSDNELINAATEKYDYILGKYTDETYTNFMERTITPSPVNSGLAPVFNQTNNIIIIVSVCVLAISAIGVFIVISKKRKEIKK